MEKIKNIFHATFAGIDKWLVLFAVLCTSYGIVLIVSATRSTSMERRCLMIQAACLVIGLVALVVISRIDYEIYLPLAKFIVIFFTIALIATYFIATPIKGNRNWINLGFINLQTSEIAKIGFIISLSVHLYKIRDNVNNFKNYIFLCAHLFMYVLPILLQSDAGSALVYLVMFAVMLFVGGVRPRVFAITGAFLVAMIPLIWEYVLRDYQKNRLLVTFNPELAPTKEGYQPILSKIALGSGRLRGNGLFSGIQTQYQLLPEKHTDFIFSVAGEELGFIGCLAVIVMLGLLLWRVIRAGAKAKDTLGLLMCTGVAAMLAAQILENIGMCIGVMPVIGITLPFFSYGGSSLLTVWFALGLVCSVTHFNRVFTLRDK